MPDKKSQSVSLEITEALEELLDESSNDKGASRAAVAQRWLLLGAAIDALEMIGEGKIGRSFAADTLGLCIDELNEIAVRYNLIFPTPREMRQASIDTALRIADEIKARRANANQP